MLGRGSPETPVKADSPVRGWSEAESLDRAEASPTLWDVMADGVATYDRVLVGLNTLQHWLWQRLQASTASEVHA